VKGHAVVGQNPAKRLSSERRAQASARLEWLVVKDNWLTENGRRSGRTAPRSRVVSQE